MGSDDGLDRMTWKTAFCGRLGVLRTMASPMLTVGATLLSTIRPVPVPLAMIGLTLLTPAGGGLGPVAPVRLTKKSSLPSARLSPLTMTVMKPTVWPEGIVRVAVIGL